MSSRTKHFFQALASPVGRKVLTGLTGLGLVLFVIVHMLGNLTYLQGGDAYNLYAHKLASYGVLLYILEVGLAAFFALHACIGISIYLRKRRARGGHYARYKTAGKPSLQTFASRTMIVSGIVLLVFLVLHLIHFKFGPGMAEGYVATIEGEQIRDLRRLMTEQFRSPLYAFGYPAVIILLGFHLRHGFWSALQSLSLTSPRLSSILYPAGALLGIVVGAGFIIVPLWIYFSQFS